MAKGNEKSSEIFTCELCEKEFKRLTSLSTHKCKIRDRLADKGSIGFRMAHKAFTVFYDFSQPKAAKKSDMDFIRSTYFEDFRKYGEFMASVKINDIRRYTMYLLTQRVPLKYWTDDVIYNKYLTNIIKTEPPETAVARSIHTMEKWAESCGGNISDYFGSVEIQTVFSQIKRGNVSPWVIYNTNSGKKFFGRLQPIHIEMIYDIIDPDYWSVTFKKQKQATEAITDTLRMAGF